MSLLSYIPLPIFQDKPTTPTKQQPSSSASSPSLSPVPISINSDWIPSFDWQELPQGQSVSYSGLEINLTTKQARLPSEGLQLTFVIPAYEHRTIRVSVNREDTIYDVCNCIINEWPGLKGRGFVRPNTNSIALKYHDTTNNISNYLANDQTVEKANLYFLQRNIFVAMFNAIDNSEIDDWMYYAKNIHQDDASNNDSASNSNNSNSSNAATCMDLVLVDVDINNDSNQNNSNSNDAMINADNEQEVLITPNTDENENITLKDNNDDDKKQIKKSFFWCCC